jgi:hypothetical protein
MPALVSLRVSPYQWKNPERLAETLAILRRLRGTISEVALFTHATHPAIPLAAAREAAAGIAAALPAFRSLGLAAGINVLATIGHLDEWADGSLAEPWQHLVGPDGRVSASCYCWSDPRVLAYVRDLYRAMAAAGPDFIWVDDDIRLVGHREAVQLACFCDGCLRSFADETGRAWTRETLVGGFDGGTREERLALRRRWLEHNRRHVDAILAAARAAVDEVRPGLPLGFMTVDATWAGQGYAAWADTLSGDPRGPAPKWRPGGGFYTDEAPGGVLVKAHATGRQVSWLPPHVRDIQYEHENGPFLPLEKSRRIFAAEMPAAVGVGCTGIALDVSLFLRDPIDEVVPWLEATAAVKPLLDAAVDALGTAPRVGVWRAGTIDTIAAKNADGAWFDPAMLGYDAGALVALAEAGLPAAYRRDGAAVTLLSGDEVLQFDRPRLEELLAGAVLLDGPGLQRLEEMGLAELAGFRVRGRKDRDTFEVFTGDALNGRFALWHRDCRPAFWGGATHLLEPTVPGARVLGEIEDLGGGRHGPGSGCCENRLGGRVAVFGYSPWRALLGLAKTSQLKAVCRWLTRERLPGYVASFHKATLWCVERPEGVAALVLGCSLDEARGLEVCVRDAAVVDLVRHDGSHARLRAARRDGPYGVFVLERLGPWEAALLTARRGAGPRSRGTAPGRPR